MRLFWAGARTTLRAIPKAWANREVRRAYLLLVFAILVVIVSLDVVGIWGTFHLIDHWGDDSILWAGTRWVLKVLSALLVLLIAPLAAISLCNILFPAFSEIPFLAGLRVVAPDRAEVLSAAQGLPVLLAIGLSARRLVLAVVVGSSCFVLGLVPVVGLFLAPVVSFYFAAHTVGWEMLDPYLDRRHLGLAEQKRFVRAHRREILGHGAICAGLLAVPLLGPFCFGILQASSAWFVVEVLEAEAAAGATK